MAIKVFDLYGEVALKGSKNVKDDLNDIDNRGSKASAAFGKIGSGLATIGKAMAATAVAAGAAMVGLAKSAIDGALELEATQAKFKTVFGDYTDQMLDTIDKFQELTPITQAAAQSMVSGIQDLLIPMGFARDEATNLTADFTHVIGALTNFNSATHTAEDVASAFQSALTGETQSLKALGIQAGIEEIKLRAVEMGLADSTEEVTKQDEALALLNIAYEQSGDALAAYNEDSLDTKTQIGLLKVEFQDAAAELGEVFLPYLNDLVDLVRNEMPTVQDTLSGVFEAVLPVMQTLAETILPAINTLLPVFADFFKNVVAPALEAVIPLFTSMAETLLPKFIGFLETLNAELLPTLIDFFEKVFEAFQPLLDSFLQLVEDDVLPLINTLFEGLGPLLVAVFDALGKLIEALKPVQEVFEGWADETLEIIVNFFYALTGLINLLGDLFEDFGPIIIAVTDALRPLIDLLTLILQLISTILGSFGDIFNADWDALGRRWVTFGNQASDTFFGTQEGVNVTESGIIPNPNKTKGVLGGSFSGAYASGGDVFNDGIYRVGELGPENVFLPQGAFVQDADTTARGNQTNLNIYNNNNPDAFQIWRQAEKAGQLMALGVS